MPRATAPRTGAIILAAGRSTRFRSARSKLVQSLAGRPIIGWLLATLHQLAVEPLVVVVAPDADEVRATCGEGVRFAVQDTPKGTGHAVQAAEASLRGYNGEHHIAWYFQRPDGTITDRERHWRSILNTFVKPIIPLNLSQCFVYFLRRQPEAGR